MPEIWDWIHMVEASTYVLSLRQVTTIDLPLPVNAVVLQPENTMFRAIGKYFDIGAFCYAIRSPKKRLPASACEVVAESLVEARIPQVLALIRVLSTFMSEGALREATIASYFERFKEFVDWADRNGHHECLSGDEGTRNAYRAYALDVEDRYRRHEFGCDFGFHKQKHVRTLLEALTGLDDLGKGIRMIRVDTRGKTATEPASQHTFQQALILNEALFQGLCELVLDFRPFPYRLQVPESLGWLENHLWLFPASQWFQHPDVHNVQSDGYNTYDYLKGCLAAEDDIWPSYLHDSEKEGRSRARRSLTKTKAALDKTNADARSHYRLMMASIAQSAFFFLFLANTGGNLQTVIDIETDGLIHDGTLNQGYRSIKWRAGAKEVDLIVPIAFMPSLRRYLEMRDYILGGTDSPYLFINRGRRYKSTPTKFKAKALITTYLLLRRIDPALESISAREIRATVADYYFRAHDAAITAAVLQNTEATALKNYNAGSETDQQIEISLLMQKIAVKAQTRVIRPEQVAVGNRHLEEGGLCQSYGHPESLNVDTVSLPSCKTSCLHCSKRILIANEDDARKVASAAFLMERLIVGPMSEAEYRPQIAKCDEDLNRIGAFEGCGPMVDRVKADVYENGNLTPYFADKYQLFLALGVL